MRDSRLGPPPTTRGLALCVAASLTVAGCFIGMGHFPVPWPTKDYGPEGWTKLGAAQLQPSDKLSLGGPYGVRCPCASSVEHASPSPLREVLVQVSGEDMSTVKHTLTVHAFELVLADGSTVVAKGPVSFSAGSSAHVVSLPAGSLLRSVRVVHDGLIVDGVATLWGR